ncbi:hypothetical protein Hanom_Chr12g01170351 [Helianthus anomalus]
MSEPGPLALVTTFCSVCSVTPFPSLISMLLDNVSRRIMRLMCPVRDGENIIKTTV